MGSTGVEGTTGKWLVVYASLEPKTWNEK